jgi:hypothetical protein
MTSLGALTGYGNELSGITVNSPRRNNTKKKYKNHRGSLMLQRKIVGNNRIGGNSPAVTIPKMQADKNMMNKAKNTLNRLMKQAGLKSNNKANATAKMNNTKMGGRRTRKRRRKRGGVGKKGYSHPKRGQKSRTRKGNKDFTTKKGNKVFHRRRHYVRKSRKPYRKRRRRGGVGVKGFSHPKAGQASLTRKGNKDFTTKKGNKDFHIQHHNIAGLRNPYTM